MLNKIIITRSAKAKKITDQLKINTVIDLLIKNTSLNTFNQKVFKLLKKHSAAAQLEKKVKPWFFFALASQEFYSPAHARENTIFQGGLLKLSKYIKYLRSEINTPIFGEPYEQNVSLIRAKAQASFVELAAQYITTCRERQSLAYSPRGGSLADFIAQDNNKDFLIVVDLDSDKFTQCYEELAQITKNKDYENAIYLKVNGTLAAAQKDKLQELLVTSKSNLQLLVGENYDPFLLGSKNMLKITLLHNQTDKLRYQLLQDGASMGYRPGIEQVIKYYFAAGRLPEILNLDQKTEDTIYTVANTNSNAQGPDTTEYQRDYQVLLDTQRILADALAKLAPTEQLSQELLRLAKQESAAIKKELQFVLAQDTLPVQQIDRVFHTNYYRLRTLLLYVARLAAESGQPRKVVEAEIKGLGDSLTLTTNSGMAATRLVVSELASRVTKIYSTPHYWESDFLIENISRHNPHFPEVKNKLADRLHIMPAELSTAQIKTELAALLAENKTCANGQLLCLDESISPFFYTKNFNLKYFAGLLDRESYKLEHPVYLVVDNTVDFAAVNAETLFPNGIPEQVYLLFTTSLAKLHQLGYDAAPGGVINIHAHPRDQQKAAVLAELLQQKRDLEGSAQTLTTLNYLNLVFYQRYKNNTMKNYLDFMVRKRQRNTEALLSSIEHALEKYFIADEQHEGTYHFKNKQTGADELVINDLQNNQHRTKIKFHYDPHSAMHAYIDILEEVEKDHVSGRVFEEIKTRIFQKAAAAGINLADGTSWGFISTRLDWYMRTMRISVGLEHNKTLARLGEIFVQVIEELITKPDEFLFNFEVSNLTPQFLKKNSEEILALAREIPYREESPPTVESIYPAKPEIENYSLVIKHAGRLVGFLTGYPVSTGGKKYLYFSKTAVAKDYRGQKLFKKMALAAAQSAKQQGIKEIVLETSASERNEYVVRTLERLETQPVKKFRSFANALYGQIHETGDLSLAKLSFYEDDTMTTHPIK